MNSPPLTDEERLSRLRLARAESVGPVTFQHLITRYGSALRALAALPDLARRGGRSQAPRIPTLDEARAELDAGAALGARLLSGGEAGFPAGLSVLDPPPPLLWVLGEADLLNRPAVAIVGARAASTAGRRFAHDLAAAIGAAGWIVVSGLARGIDTAAHQGAVASGTVAVLGGGVDDIYPPENAALHADLIGRGCIVSERPPGVQARAADFPRRNRIISGLCLGVVVVEAELRSGSLITARLAGEQGREVFAVPGSPLDPRCRGTNDLLRQGAHLVEDADDVLRVLESLPGLREEPSLAGPPPSADASSADPAADAALLEHLETLISPAPTSIDTLARDSGAPVAAVLAALMEMALAGRVELAPGGLVIGL